MAMPTIPENITIHLGDPDQPARNITVPFVDYIKNVASSEIYPTWPDSALRANILAQVSFALNRVYTEWYRSRGYDFDITNSTRYDQKYIENRDLFDNIVKLVDDLFNDYVVKQGSVEPYFTQYCSGTTVTCEGLSQWGTVDLAEQGMFPYQILQYYYGDDINIVYDAPLAENVPSYPETLLRLGSSGEEVRTIQRQLNRISDNYPAIPKIPVTDGIFNVQTENSVKEFQKIFNLTVDGIVGKATWYKIKFIYNSVKRLAELSSEGISPEEAAPLYSSVLREGDTGTNVAFAQYYLALISFVDPQIPQVVLNGVFDENMKNSVIAFQQKYGLEPNGEIDRRTWNKVLEVYNTTIQALKQQYVSDSEKIYPGIILTPGSSGDDISTLQRLLQQAAQKNSSIPSVEVTGTFDGPTENAVRVIQAQNSLPVNGSVGPLTWAAIVNIAESP